MSTSEKSRPQRKPQRSSQRKPRRSKGWKPDQHGAWAMVAFPALTGLILQPSWQAIPVLLTWWFGYFAFFAASIWMRSRFRPINRKPVLVYGSATAVFGVISLIANFSLLWWILPYAPLVAIAVYETYRRRPRSLASGWATVFAAILMAPVAASAGVPVHLFDLDVPGQVWVAVAVYGAYYLGSVPYVKTLIRERGKKNWLIGSIGFHVAVLIAFWLTTVAGITHWFTVVVFAVLAIRAAAMPISGQRRTKPWRPRTIGLLELGLSIFVVVAAFL